MARHKKTMNQIRALVENLNGKFGGFEKTKRHWRVKFLNSRKEECMVTWSDSASCYRAFDNALADIKRAFR